MKFGDAGPHLQVVRLTALMRELLTERRTTHGWVRVPDLARMTGIPVSTVYRYLNKLEERGMFPIERCPKRGVRSMHVLARRDAPLHHRTPTGAVHVHQ